jgi:hypothetical protein
MIHLNGSGKENLQRDWREAHEAVRQAMNKVSLTAPHMRDYYPMKNGEEVYRQARDEHDLRMINLQNMLREFEELYHSTLS